MDDKPGLVISEATEIWCVLLEVTQFDPCNCKVIVSSAFRQNEKGNRQNMIFGHFLTFVISINIFVTPWEDI